MVRPSGGMSELVHQVAEADRKPQPADRKSRQGQAFDSSLMSTGYEPVPTEEATDEFTQKTSPSKRRLNKIEKEMSKCTCASTVLQSTLFQVTSILCILANAVCIGFETDMPGLLIWDVLETGFLVFFTIELVLRVFVAGLVYFFSCVDNPELAWNCFDLLLVLSGLLGFVQLFVSGKQKSKCDATLFRVIRIARVLRILRVIRVIRFLKQLYLLAYGFVEGAMAVFWVAILATVIIYMCAIIIVRTYAHLPEHAPQHELFSSSFGTVPGSMFTLFEIMASPSLDPYRVLLMDYPGFASFICIFVIFGSFGINGLLTGVISESIFEKNQARIEETRLERESKRNHLMNHSAELFEELDTNGVGHLQPDQLALHAEDIIELFQSVGVAMPKHDLDQMIHIMDYNENGLIEKEEFVNFMVEMCEDIRPMSIMELHSLVTRCNLKIERCDNKVESVVRQVDDMAIHREGESKKHEELAHHMRQSQFVSHGLMHRMKDMVENLSDQKGGRQDVGLQSNSHGDSKSSTLAKRRGLDAAKFKSAPSFLSDFDSGDLLHKGAGDKEKSNFQYRLSEKLRFRDRRRLHTHSHAVDVAQSLVAEDFGCELLSPTMPHVEGHDRMAHVPRMSPRAKGHAPSLGRRAWSWDPESHGSASEPLSSWAMGTAPLLPRVEDDSVPRVLSEPAWMQPIGENGDEQHELHDVMPEPLPKRLPSQQDPQKFPNTSEMEVSVTENVSGGRKRQICIADATCPELHEEKPAPGYATSHISVPAPMPLTPISLPETVSAPATTPAAAANSALVPEPASVPSVARELALLQPPDGVHDKDASLEEARHHLQSLMRIQASLHAAGDLANVREFRDLMSTALARLVLDSAQFSEKRALSSSTAVDASSKSE